MRMLVENGTPRYPGGGVSVMSCDASMTLQVLNTFSDVVWHASWSITGDILAVSGGDNKVIIYTCTCTCLGVIFIVLSIS